MKPIRLFTILLFISSMLSGQNTPFNKGVNLTNWLQAGSAQQIQFSKYNREDFEQIKSLGCDVIRLPINLHFMTNGAPDYTLDPLFISFLDEIISWTEDLGIHLILDNHTFDSATDTDQNVGVILTKVWPQMAQKYLSTSNKIYYEVLNEPHGISDALWNSIQQEVVTAIRKIDTKHTIIVGPASWNSYNSLNKMPIYNDENLIYTFHFYDPFLFTHQGASWTDMTDLGGVPFPYSADKMPTFPTSLNGTWIQTDFNKYNTSGTINEVHRLIDIAVAFQQERNVPIFCGEFGVFDKLSPDADRTFWYGVVREYLEANNIAWTIWDYHGGFGIFKKGGNGMFYHDLNVPLVENLGLTAPEQTPFVIMPDNIGFEVYGDYSGKAINSSSYSQGDVNFYSNNHPNNGAYCIEWSNASQYDNINFNFAPDKDFSFLIENNYALDFIIRGSDPNGSIDVRFVDSDKGDEDHPWRNKFTINKETANWNGKWNHLFVPLTNFTEQGAWENEWFNPEGLFDWTKIDLLQFVSEEKGMGENTIWIDNIYISNLDTAQVNTNIGFNKYNSPKLNFAEINQNRNLISIYNKTENEIEYILFDSSGKIWSKDKFKTESHINTTHFPKGLYLVRIFNSEQQLTEKILFK